MNAHRRAIHRVTRAYAHSEADRSELFQEIVYQLWRAYPSFRGQSGALTWLYRVALNTAITARRRQARRPEEVALARRDPAAPDATGNSRAEVLYQAIRELGDVDRAVVMCYLDGLSYERIAAVLGISETNVGARLSRARTHLRDLVRNLE